MATDKKSFIFYCDWKDTFDQLPDEKSGELIKFLLAYVNDENPQTDDLLINAVFANIKNALKRDLKKFEQRAERARENGQKGGRPKTQKTQSVNSKPKKPDSDNDNVSVNVNDNSNVESIDFDGMLNFFNETFGRSFRVINKAVRAKYKARLKEGYTRNDIVNAALNCKRSSTHKETNYQYCTPEFFSRANILDKWGTTTTPQKEEVKVVEHWNKDLPTGL